MGSTTADAGTVRDYILWLESRDFVERYAIFTNIINGDEAWFPPHWSVDMALVQNGALTEIGILYRDLKLFEIFIPLVSSGGS